MTTERFQVGAPVVSLSNPKNVMLVREVILKGTEDEYLCTFVSGDGSICNSIFSFSEIQPFIPIEPDD